MLKVIIPIILFIFTVYGTTYYWAKANSKYKKKITITVGIVLIVILSVTIYLLID